MREGISEQSQPMSAAPEYEHENKSTDSTGLSASMAAATDSQIAHQFGRTSSPLDSAIYCPFMIVSSLPRCV